MKKTLAGVLCAGIVAAWIVDSQLTPREARPVVTIGSPEAPLPPPRVRVRNNHATAVQVAYATVDGHEPHLVGTVPGLATKTFPLPERLSVMRIVVQAEADGERFLTGEIPCDGDTDITVNVASPLEQSVVEVARLPVIRELSSR